MSGRAVELVAEVDGARCAPGPGSSTMFAKSCDRLLVIDQTLGVVDLSEQ